jgi:hypothetical protein
MHIKLLVHTQEYWYDFLKTLHPMGFEPGSSVPEAYAMSTAPCRHGRMDQFPIPDRLRRGSKAASAAFETIDPEL